MAYTGPTTVTAASRKRGRMGALADAHVGGEDLARQAVRVFAVL